MGVNASRALSENTGTNAEQLDGEFGPARFTQSPLDHADIYFVTVLLSTLLAGSKANPCLVMLVTVNVYVPCDPLS